MHPSHHVLVNVTQKCAKRLQSTSIRQKSCVCVFRGTRARSASRKCFSSGQTRFFAGFEESALRDRLPRAACVAPITGQRASNSNTRSALLVWPQRVIGRSAPTNELEAGADGVRLWPLIGEPFFFLLASCLLSSATPCKTIAVFGAPRQVLPIKHVQHAPQFPCHRLGLRRCKRVSARKEQVESERISGATCNSARD